MLALTIIIIGSLSLMVESDQLAPPSDSRHSEAVSLPSGIAVWSENFTTRVSTFWIAVTCPSESDCEQLNLTVTDSAGTQFTTSGRFHLELMGNVSYGLTNVMLTREGITTQELAVSYIFHDTHSGEFGDAPSQLPNPQEDSSEWPLAEVDGCKSFHSCGVVDRTEIDAQAVWLNGTLESIDDSDTFRLNSSEGDLIEIEVTAISSDITLEVWNRSQEALNLVTQQQFNSGSGFSPSRLILEQTTDETWISIGGMGSELSLYSLRLANHSQSYELHDDQIDMDLPQNPIFHTLMNGSASGHLISGDEGDSVILQGTGSRSVITLDWYLSAPAEMQILTLDGTWKTTHILTDSQGTLTFTTPEDSASTGVRVVNASQPLIWQIEYQNQGPWDGGWFGDAPDNIPTAEIDTFLFPKLATVGSSLSGEVGGEDIRDVYLVQRVAGTPYHSILSVTIEGDPGSCTLKLIQLNTTSYADWSIIAWNESEMVGQQSTGAIDLPYGLHAVMVESNINETTDYSITWQWVENGEEPEEEAEWEDYSDSMTGFYIIIGIVFLMPLMVAYFWSLKEKGVGEIQEHQRRRLDRLLERLTAADPANQNDPHALLHALDTLRDTDWEKLLIQWGKPLTRHTTDGLDVAIWQLSATQGNLSVAVGLNVEDGEWTLAAMRFQAIEGGEWAVVSSTPEAMFEGDEVFLGNLKQESRHFYRIDLAGGAGGFDLILSGMMNDEPIAAIPTQAALISTQNFGEEE